MRESKRGATIYRLLVIVLSIALLIWFAIGLGDVEQQQNREGQQQLETALRRAAVACYATEGVYPPNLEYLEEHYGVQVDEDKYYVYYNIFADNIMPEITVVGKAS
jgi:hypothetical protein